MYATKEGVVNVDLEEGVAEVDVGLSVKQCVEWDGRDTSGITQDQHILNGRGKEKKVMFELFLVVLCNFHLLK